MSEGQLRGAARRALSFEPRMIDEAEAGRRLDTLIMVSETTALPVVKNIIADRGSAHGVPADRLYADPESGGLFARTAHGGRRSTLSGRELDLTATEHDLLCALGSPATPAAYAPTTT